jgi:hypothetical protein
MPNTPAVGYVRYCFPIQELVKEQEMPTLYQLPRIQGLSSHAVCAVCICQPPPSPNPQELMKEQEMPTLC